MRSEWGKAVKRGSRGQYEQGRYMGEKKRGGGPIQEWYWLRGI